MNRREFMKVGAGATVVGAGDSTSGAPADTATSGPATTPAVLRTWRSEDHRRRLENIARCERGIHKCLRKHLITDYLPGQCVYNLGEYPCQIGRAHV